MLPERQTEQQSNRAAAQHGCSEERRYFQFLYGREHTAERFRKRAFLKRYLSMQWIDEIPGGLIEPGEGAVYRNTCLGTRFHIAMIAQASAAVLTIAAVISGIDNDTVAYIKIINGIAFGHYDTSRFMTDDHLLPGGVFAGNNAQVCTTDTGAVDLYDHFFCLGNGRFFFLFDPDIPGPLINNCFHCRVFNFEGMCFTAGGIICSAGNRSLPHRFVWRLKQALLLLRYQIRSGSLSGSVYDPPMRYQ